jgi:hypothetical protein
MKRTIIAVLALFAVGVSQFAFADEADKAKCTAKCKEKDDGCTKKAGSDPLKKAACAKELAECTKGCSDKK